MFRPVVLAASCAALALLLTPEPTTPASGSGDGIDTGSAMDSAALFARFGEPNLALSASVSRNGEETRSLNVRLLTEMGRYSRADSMLAAATVIADTARYYLQRARLNFLAGEFDVAERLLRAGAGLSGQDMEGYREYLFARIAIAKGDAAAAVAIGEVAVAGPLPEALRDEFEETLVEAYHATGRNEDALARARALRGRSRESERRLRLLRTEYEIAMATENRDAAVAATRRLVVDHRRDPGTVASVDVVLSRFGTSSLSDRDLLSFASFLRSQRRLGDARRLLRELDGRRLSAADRESLQIQWASYHYAAGAYSQAARLAKPAFNDRGNRRESMLILARSYRRLGQKHSAARLYERFAEVFPNDIKAAEALYVALRLYDDLGDTRGEARVTETMRRSYPSTYFGRLAAFREARAQIASGAHDRAISFLEYRLKRSNGTDETALFYMSRLLRTTGDNERSGLLLNELAKIDPYSFYLTPSVPLDYRRPATASVGTISREGLLELLAAAEIEKERAMVRIAGTIGDAGIPPEVEACVARAEWFFASGFRDWAERELAAARPYCDGNAHATMVVADVFERYAMPWRSVRLYQRARDETPWQTRREFDAEWRRLLYPIPYPAQVLENATRYGLPPHLAYAMIREESRFDSGAVSRAGAIGLMQLMPATAREVARELELSFWDESDLLEPEVNITFGIWYASSLLSRGDNNFLWMLAAYNAGPSNARRWFPSAEMTDEEAIGYVDDIDFRETRYYVQRIVESANVYHALYFARPGGAD